jgi:hypothetical protein
VIMDFTLIGLGVVSTFLFHNGFLDEILQNDDFHIPRLRVLGLSFSRLKAN